MSDPKFHRFPHSGDRPGRFSGSDRAVRIERLKKDAPALDKKRDHQTSARSMTFAVLAAVGVMALFYLMNLLDSVGEPPAEDHLHRVDTIEAAPEARIEALIDRIEREAVEAGEAYARELEALIEMDGQLQIDPWAEPDPRAPADERLRLNFLPGAESDFGTIEDLIPPAELDVDGIDP